MTTEHEVVNVDYNQSTNQSIDREAWEAKLDPATWGAKLNPATWTEEAAVEISDEELDALRDAAITNGAVDITARSLGHMLSTGAAPELVPALRLAYAHALAVTGISNSINGFQSRGGRCNPVHDLANGFDQAQRTGKAERYRAELAAQYDWPAVVKRKAELAAKNNIIAEAKYCWLTHQPPTSEAVRAEMIAHQRRRRDELKSYGLSDDEIRVHGARSGHSYEDGKFYTSPEIEKAEKLQALLDDPAFDEEEGDGPILDYYDPETGLLPSYPGGGILEVIGPAQSYKTTAVTRLCCSAMARNRDLKVLYLAGELPAQVRRMRNAYGEAEGLTEDDVKARFRVHNGMPAMHDQENADRILEIVETFGANIVVLDTWARAIAGLREISDAPGNMLAEAGEIGRLATLGVLVVIIGHCPLSQEKRLRGNSSADNAGDARLWVIGNAKGFKVEVLKMKPVPPGHAVFAKVPPVAPNLSPADRALLPPPVITWCGKAEYDKAVHDPRKSKKSEPSAEEGIAAPVEEIIAAPEEPATGAPRAARPPVDARRKECGTPTPIQGKEESGRRGELSRAGGVVTPLVTRADAPVTPLVTL